MADKFQVSHRPFSEMSKGEIMHEAIFYEYRFDQIVRKYNGWKEIIHQEAFDRLSECNAEMAKRSLAGQN